MRSEVNGDRSWKRNEYVLNLALPFYFMMVDEEETPRAFTWNEMSSRVNYPVSRGCVYYMRNNQIIRNMNEKIKKCDRAKGKGETTKWVFTSRFQQWAKTRRDLLRRIDA